MTPVGTSPARAVMGHLEPALCSPIVPAVTGQELVLISLLGEVPRCPEMRVLLLMEIEVPRCPEMRVLMLMEREVLNILTVMNSLPPMNPIKVFRLIYLKVSDDT